MDNQNNLFMHFAFCKCQRIFVPCNLHFEYVTEYLIHAVRIYVPMGINGNYLCLHVKESLPQVYYT